MAKFKIKKNKIDKIIGNSRIKRLKVVPVNNKSFSLDDVEQFYDYLIDEKKFDPNEILMGAFTPKGRIHLKRYEDDDLFVMDFEDYFEGRVKRPSKFTNNVYAIDIYIKRNIET